MTDGIEAISATAKKLSPMQRLALVEELLDSLDAPDKAVDALWIGEAEDRVAAYRRGEIEAVPMVTVLAKHTPG
ncbi:putative addiction module component, TIGR02574 family [Rhizobiales bacterium GAS191]|nr:putative addiction module component, TIGR02574 family [Rhizobiales bacterium GAS113]SEC23487.1 putative addiction module component, TIGR02574 family [Rhizobiales bacterium GAS191]SEC99764.1 putative addiction module component, TIGR02574 family [Rhizobiales bacterium GAS188]